MIGLILLILLVAGALRLWGLPGIPPGPHYDEAANGILAAEIADGKSTPVFIPSYTGKEVLFFYVTALTMRLFDVGLFALRLTSALIGLTTVAVAVWMVYELFIDDDPSAAPWLAALTAALLATSFWHVLLSRIGFRAITQPLLQALTLAALWRGLRKNDRYWLILGGIFCGLTAYTYLAARAVPIPLFIVLGVLLIADVGRRRERLVQSIWFGLAALFSFLPLAVYFAQNPDAFTNRMNQVGPGGDFGAALDGLIASVKMLFAQGDPYIRFNLPFRPLFGPVIAFFLVVGLGVTVWRFVRSQAAPGSFPLARAREVLLLIWVPVMLLPTALAVNEITPSNLRAIGLIPLVFILAARGLWTLLEYVMSKFPISRTVLIITICLLLFGTGLITARAYFGEYAQRTDLYEASDGDLADIAAYLNRADLTGTSVYVGSIHYRHPTLALLSDVYSQIKWLVGASTVVFPFSGDALYLFPRSANPDPDWLDDYLAGARTLEVPVAVDGAPAFAGYRLEAASQLSEEILADFSGVIHLVDYRVERAVSGDAAEITVVWQILAPPPFPGLMPFYHLVDAQGLRWGQAEPFQYAAADWTPGEIVIDRVQVPVGLGAPPGAYFLESGLYSRNADARLAIVDADGQYIGTTVPLTLTVDRAETPPDPDLLGIRQRLDLETGAGLTLLGANLDSTQARPGERVHLTLFWQADPTSDPRPDHIVHLFLQDLGGDDLSIYQGELVQGTYPTSQWTSGEIVVDRYNPRLPLSTADALPGEAPVALVVTTTDGVTLLGPVVLGALDLIASGRTFDLPAISHSQHAALADQVEFLGYDIDLADARPGGTVELVLYWRALAEMDTGYTVFTHVLDPDRNIVAQQDNVPVYGTYPTTLWLPGEIITDPYTIALPDDLPEGDYAVQVGFYVAQDGLRLADAILLGAFVSIPP